MPIGMERQFFAVTADMVENLNAIGITVTDHVLYLTHVPRRHSHCAGAAGRC
jgi:hypothetical protein